MKKKILSLVLALLMAIPSAAFVAADDAAVTTETETTATEAAEPAPTAAVEDETAEDEESPYMYAVEFLAQYGIFKGYSADNPGIEDPIQRYQMALFVSRISTGWTDDEKWEDGSLNATPFYDVDVDPVNKYLGAISYANQKGIIEGVSAHHFEPQEGINYQDALTMLVRTLGWTGLKHPWGYIQKAVEIGLTEGIKDVAYTQELTRGEVAQLVYNAMFIAGANGTKLALTQFGVEFGWETIIITASDRVKNDGSDKLATADGQKRNAYVAFRLFDETTGKATGATYYALAKALKLDPDKNEDDAAVGHTYNVLFEKAATDATAKYGDSEIVNIVDVNPTYLTTVKNEGLTDDEGVARTTVDEIGKFLTDYTLVDKYTPAAYVGAVADKVSGTNTRALAKEIMIYDANGTVDVVTGKDTRDIAIDFQTGDILVACDKDDDDMKYKVGDVYYKVAWYYNATLDRYYQYAYLKDANGEYQVGVNYMDDDEWVKFYNDTVTHYEATQALVVNTSKDVFKNAAYASLYVEDINNDGIADRGIYKTYRFGYLNANATKKCDHTSKPAYELTTYNRAMVWNGSVGTSTTSVYSNPNDLCWCTDYTKAAWFADPTYVPKTGFVIYSYNSLTNEIEVVKELGTYAAPLGTDKDSYVARGVLQAYSVSSNTITIAGQKPLTADYGTLAGVPVLNMNASGNDDEKAWRKAYADGLYSMLEQYVEYVVVDGKIVYIALTGTSSTELLVVKRYAGTTDDGYIAVDAYSTATGELGTYVIGSYNGWKQGDYYYFLTEEKVEESFTPGVIYQIKSYDEKEDLYYVETAGEFDTNNKYTLAANGNYLTSVADVEIKSVSDGYYDINWKDSDGKAQSDYVRKSSSDLFIFIPDQNDKYKNHAITAGTFRAPIYVYKGTLPNSMEIVGTRITHLNGSKQNVYIFADVNADDMMELYKSLDAFDLHLYLYQGGRVFSAAYDSAAAGSLKNGRYLLGATTSEVEMFDLYTGGTTTVKTDRNINLQKNHIYAAVSGQIVEDVSDSSPREDSGSVEETQRYTAVSMLLQTLAKYYPQNFIQNSGDTYKFGTFMLNVNAWLAADTNAKKAKFMNDVIGGEGTGTDTDLYTSNLIDENGSTGHPAPYQYDRDRIPEGGVTFHTVTIGSSGYTWEMDATSLSKWLETHKGVTAVGAGYVYDVAKATIVVYVDLSAGQTNTSVSGKTLDAPVWTGYVDGEEVSIKETITYDMTTVDGKVTVTVTDVKFEFVGTDKLPHDTIAQYMLAFGHKDDHVMGTYYTSSASGTDPQINGLYDYADGYNWGTWVKLVPNYADVEFETYTCDECNLVKSIKFTGLKAVIGGNEDDQATFTLCLNITAPNQQSVPTSEYYKLALKVGTTVSITATGELAKKTITPYVYTEGSYLAIDTNGKAAETTTTTGTVGGGN